MALAVLTGCASDQPPIRLLTKANALPLALDPEIQVRKVKYYFLENPSVIGERTSDTSTEEQSIAYERQYLSYGALTGSDIRNAYGDYYTFFWRSTHANPVHLTVRLEYRQQKTGGFVQAREVDYPNAVGSHATRFSVNGDDYFQEGRVSAWRILLIENHQTIVAFRQSYLWR